jgi:peptidoglycan/xylan/chitin deacetylase (PgdA/CDA1 family)
MKLAPEAVEQMLRSGHEIAAHSYTQDNILAYLERDEEQTVIARCIEVFRKLTGAPPKGWLSPVLASSAHTEELLTAAGFLWYGDYNHIDLPFCVEPATAPSSRFPTATTPTTACYAAIRATGTMSKRIPSIISIRTSRPRSST